jgi:hypothetical protein
VSPIKADFGDLKYGEAGLSSFGNFVFWDYGVTLELGIDGKADLYLRGEDGL